MSRLTSLPKRSLGLWIGGALLALGLTACGAATQGTTETSFDPGSGVTADGTSAIAADLAFAPWQVEYHGTRRLDFFTESPAVSYREKVAADGHGQFGIEVTEVLTTHYDPAGFIAKQGQNVGFNYRYRGFRVLDPFLFEANYTVQTLSQDTVVAGVDCTRLLVQKNVEPGQSAPNHYLVDMDLDSGLVLGWEELDSTGRSIARMQFETFGLGAGTNPIPMSAGSVSEHEIAVTDLDGPEMAFKVLRPRLLPDAYRLSKAYQVVDGSQNLWMRQVFTDGQDALIFMHKKQIRQVAGFESKSTLGVYEEGQWTMLMGDINGYSMMAVGKVGSSVIEEFVSSCFQ